MKAPKGAKYGISYIQGFLDRKMNKIYDKDVVLLTIFLSSVFIMGFVVPVILYPMPTGTDVYTHMFYTELMLNSDSLYEYYNNCFQEGYVGYSYPFGMRLFGSMISKITGLAIYEMSYILPVLLLVVVIGLYYTYSGIFLASKKQAILSALFLIAMPNVTMSILGYYTAAFSIPILLSIVYFALNEKMSFNKRIILMSIFIFSLVITHTGTYMFLMFFAMMYVLIYAIVWGKMNTNAYLLLAGVLIIYTITMWIFPHIQSQYIDKSRLVLTVGDFISTKVGLGFAGNLSQIFYERVFVEKSLIDAIFWSAFIYIIVKIIAHLRSMLPGIDLKRGSHYLQTIPILGNIRYISHSLLSSPFWIGPLHVLLSLVGVFKINKRGLAMLLSIIVVAFLPGSLQTGSTGALKEVIYFFMIIPVLSAFGYCYVVGKIAKFDKNNIQIFALLLLFLVILLPLILMPVIGNLYYRPEISGTEYEINGMRWLSGIGDENEGSSGYGYRHMISIYADKKAPDASTIKDGSESTYFRESLSNVYFSQNSENEADDLYSTFGIKYLISSYKVIRNLVGTSEDLKIDHNEHLDKLYSSKENFAIYGHVEPSVISHKGVAGASNINFDEAAVIPQDAGIEYLIVTDSYKVRVMKSSPEINYLGNKYSNFFEDGFFSDYLWLSWQGGPYEKLLPTYYYLSRLEYPIVTVEKNQISYKTVLKNGDENWATLIVRYTFYQKVIKMEIIVANDWMSFNKDAFMEVGIYTRTFSELSEITYYTDGVAKKRRIYPSQDDVELDEKFNEIFLANGDVGTYILYDKTSPYPKEISYQGSTLYSNYSSLTIGSRNSISPADSIHVTQYISIGGEESAKNNLLQYTSTYLLPYKNARTPIVLTSYIDSPVSNMDSGDYYHMLKAHDQLKRNGANKYTEGVNVQDDMNIGGIEQLVGYKSDIMGYDDLYDGFYDVLTVQEDKIKNIMRQRDVFGFYGTSNLNYKGFVPNQLKYNLDTINLLDKYGISFAEVLRINAPSSVFFQEGLRQPKIAYYHGNETGVVLLPVSNPTSSNLVTSLKKSVDAWTSAIDSAIENDDVCVFLWLSEDIGKPEYISSVLQVVDYAKNRDTVFTTPYEIANHFKLLKNIHAEISLGIDSVKISVTNDNEEMVDGVAFKVITPVIDGHCPYTSYVSQIEKITRNGVECHSYLKVDLGGKETKSISVEPNITRDEFEIEIPAFIIEGDETSLKINNLEGSPVPKVKVTINTSLYETVEDGTFKVNLRRGNYEMKLEKPGFATEIHVLEIKSRVFLLAKTPIGFYILVALLIIFSISLKTFAKGEKSYRIYDSRVRRPSSRFLKKLVRFFMRK